MPMFEYRCGSCGHAFERYEAGRSAGQAEKVACTRCGKERPERIISIFSAGCGGGGGNVSIGTAGCGGGGGGFS